MAGVFPIERSKPPDFIALRLAMPTGQLEVFSLHVQDHGRTLEQQQVRDDEADAFTRAGWGNHQTMGPGRRAEKLRPAFGWAGLRDDEAPARHVEKLVGLQLACLLPVGAAEGRQAFRQHLGREQKRQDDARAQDEIEYLEGPRIIVLQSRVFTQDRQPIQRLAVVASPEGQEAGANDVGETHADQHEKQHAAKQS